MDMRFYWLECRQIQEQLHLYWKEVKINKADYPTKHRPTKYHIVLSVNYLLNMLQVLNAPPNFRRHLIFLAYNTFYNTQ